MAKIRAKIGEIRAKTAAALEDVPDTLIGTIIFLTVLTAIAIGLFQYVPYKV